MRVPIKKTLILSDAHTGLDIAVARMLLCIALLTSGVNMNVVLGLPRSYDASVSLEGAGSYAGIIFKTVILAACGLAFVLSWRPAGTKWRLWPFVAFFLWACVGCFVANMSVLGFRQLASWLTHLLFLAAAMRVFDASKDTGLLKACLIGAVVISAAAGVAQYALGHGSSIGQMGEKFMVHTGAGSNLQQAIIPIFAGLFLIVDFAYRKKLFSAIGGAILIVWGSLVGLRGSILGLVVAMVAIAFFMRPRRRVWILVLIIGIVVTAVGSTLLEKSFTSEGDFNTHGRFKNWPYLLAYGLESPIIGHGPSGDMLYFARKHEGRGIGDAHNEYIGLFVSFGIPGFGFYIIGLASLFWKILKFRPFNIEGEVARTSAFAMLTCVVVNAASNNVFRQPEVMIAAFAVPAACLAAATRSQCKGPVTKLVVGTAQGRGPYDNEVS